jgi:alpha-tubulin suppressor-like RCC1 family protein
MLSTTTASIHKNLQCRILRSSFSVPSKSSGTVRNKGTSTTNDQSLSGANGGVISLLPTTTATTNRQYSFYNTFRYSSSLSITDHQRTRTTTQQNIICNRNSGDLLLLNNIPIISTTISTRYSSSTTTSSSDSNNNKQDILMWGIGPSESLLLQQHTTTTDTHNNNDEISTMTVPVPTLVHTDRLLQISTNTSGIKSIICGKEYGETAIIYNDGKCYVCGPNTDGKLGVGHTNLVHHFTEVIVPSEDPTTIGISSVVFGDNYTAYIDTVGDLYTCGSCKSSSTIYSSLSSGSLFRLGHGPNTIQDGTLYPTLVSSLVEDGCRVQKVTLGIDHMTVLTTDGEVLTVGCSMYGKLGNSTDTDDHLYLHPVEALTGGGGSDGTVIDISGGNEHTLALTKDGTVYGWGRANRGQLGTFFGMMIDNDAKQTIPEPIQSDDMLTKHIIQISTGPYNSSCLSQSGEVYTWGSMATINSVAQAPTTTATNESNKAEDSDGTSSNDDAAAKKESTVDTIPIQPQQNEPTPVYDVANVKMVSIYDSFNGLSYLVDDKNIVYTVGYHESKSRFGNIKKKLQVSTIPFVTSQEEEQEQKQFTFESMSIGTNHASAIIKYK